MTNLRSRNEYSVTGMSCGHCEAAVREEVGALTGVDELEVSATTGRLTVDGTGVDPAAVIAAVDEAGYSAESTGEVSGAGS